MQFVRCQVSKRVSRPASWLVDGRSGDSNHLNIILLGADVLAGELSSQVTSDGPIRARYPVT